MTSLAHAQYRNAFLDGEVFRYRVSWGLFNNAGEIRISAKAETRNDRPVMRIRMVTSTKGVVRGFFSYEDTAEAIIDTLSGRLIQATEKVDQGERSINSTTSFDYTSRLARHRDLARPSRNTDIPIPEGSPVDLLSALIGSRYSDLKTGTKQTALIFAGRDIYPVTIFSSSVERLSYEGREINAMLLIPRMENEPPRGIFKRGGEIRVWVDCDNDHLPVRMQLRLKIGTAHLALVEHSLPASNSP